MIPTRPPGWSIQGESTWSRTEKGLLEETIIPSPNSLDLQRTALSDYVHRFTSTSPHVAELFQENTKLTPFSTLAVPRDDRSLEELREWFFTTAYAPKEDEVDPARTGDFRATLNDLRPEALGVLLGMFSEPGPVANLLYSVDLLVLQGRRLFRLVPRTAFLWIERDVTHDKIQALKAAILDVPAPTLARSRTFLFLVPCAWRYMLLYGPRGYRHTLLDAGRILAHLEGSARAHNLAIAVSQDFYDKRVDQFLYVDGVERSVVAIVALQGEDS
jgi:hypothetical protein